MSESLNGQKRPAGAIGLTLSLNKIAIAALLFLLPCHALGQPTAPSAGPPAPSDEGVKPLKHDPNIPNYPVKARRERKAGKATIQCHVTANAMVTDCEVLSEDPPGYGFGAAAVNMAPLFKLKPASQDGKAGDGTFTTTINFTVPE